MSHPLSVRVATLDDLAAVVELRLALLDEYSDDPLYGRRRADAEARAREIFGVQLRSQREAIFLAERGDRVIGVLRCVDTPALPLLPVDRYCYVSSVYVRPDARRTGVLRALMRAAEQWCADRGIADMRLHNSVHSDVARRTWTAMGFEVVEEVRRRLLPAPRPHRPVPHSRAAARG